MYAHTYSGSKILDIFYFQLNLKFYYMLLIMNFKLRACLNKVIDIVVACTSVSRDNHQILSVFIMYLIFSIL